MNTQELKENNLQRGGCLTVFLGFMVVANLLTAITYVTSGATLLEMNPDMPSWAIPVLIMGSLANVVFAIAVWFWQKWGVYGFGATSAVAFVINLIALGIFPALFGLIGVGLLAYLIRDAWPHMK